MDRRRFCNLNLGLIVGGIFGNLEEFSGTYSGIYEEYCELSKREILLGIIGKIAKYAYNNYTLGYAMVNNEVDVMFPNRFKIEEQFFDELKDKERLWRGEMEIEVINGGEECKSYRKIEVSVCNFLLGINVSYPFDGLSRTDVLRKLLEDDKTIIRKSISAMVLGHGVLQFYLSGYGDNDGVYLGINGGWDNIHRNSIDMVKEDGEVFWRIGFPFRPRHGFYLDKIE